MQSKTIYALEKFDNPHDFERMAGDIMNGLGFKDVVLIAPRGGSDEGRDITFTTESGGKGLACISLRKDISKKFKEDFSQRAKGEFEKCLLITNQYLTAKEKRDYAKYCLDNLEAEFVPYDIEAIRSLLDTALKSVRSDYLKIDDDDVETRIK